MPKGFTDTGPLPEKIPILGWESPCLVDEWDWKRDALARIANTYGVEGTDDVAAALREFAWAASRCETGAEYNVLLRQKESA